MLRMIAVLFGIAFVFAGVAGFLPTFIINGLLFGFFEVNSMHNLFHLVTGVLAIMAATNTYYARRFFQIFGIIYALLAIIGFWRGGDAYFMHFNTADNIFHIVVGVVSIYLGFVVNAQENV